MDVEKAVDILPWNASNLASMFQIIADRYRGETALVSHEKKDKTRDSLTYDELFQRASLIAEGFIKWGLDRGDRVMILADNRLEWMVTSMSVTLAGGVDVPRGNDATDDEVNYILSHSASKFLVVENARHLKRVLSIINDIDSIERIIVMDEDGLSDKQLANPKISSLEKLHALGKEHVDQRGSEVSNRIIQVQPEEPYTMIYTSGTTGRPKGVVITHANMMSQVLNVPIDIKRGWSVLSILPIWHSYERAFEAIVFARGVSLTYSSVKTIGADMKSVRPQIMVSAPRLWENVYSRIQHNIRSSSVFKRGMFKVAYFFAYIVNTAVSVLGDQFLETRFVSFPERLLRKFLAVLALIFAYLPFRLMDIIVFKKLRAVIGGRFKCTVSGGGALPTHIDKFFNYIGIIVLEGYGMTESSPVLSVRLFANKVIGTVGPIWPDTEVRIVDPETKNVIYPNSDHPYEGKGEKGEIHVKGPQVMQGYFRSPEETAKVIHDGWLNTGDLGMVTFNGSLKILGRTKDTVVLLSGENIEPVPIENKLSHSDLIESCMIVGQDEKYLGLLVVPSVEGFAESDLKLKTIEEIIKSEEARKVVDHYVHESISTKTGFKNFERIHSWRWISKPFEVGEELTSTFKLKRHVITQKYSDELESMFVHLNK